MASVTNEFFYQDYANDCLFATVHENGESLCISTSKYGNLEDVRIVSVSPDKVKELIKFLQDNFG